MKINVLYNRVSIFDKKYILYYIIFAILSLSISINFVFGAVIIIIMLLCIVLVTHLSNISQIFLKFLGFVLIGYMIGGRGFAYFGYYPIFIGEIALFIGVLTILIYSFQKKTFLSALPLKLLILLFLSLGIIHLFIDFSKYGILALRDSVIWGYGIFAIAVYIAFKNKENYFAMIPKYYGKILPFIFIWISIFSVIYRLIPEVIPRWPSPLGQNNLMFQLKGGDIAVHLTGITSFILLGLYKSKSNNSFKKRIFITLMGINLIRAAAGGRGAFLSMVAGILVIGLFNKSRAIVKLILIFLLLFFVFDAMDLNINLGTKRNISTENVLIGIKSIFSKTDANVYEGSKRWRLMWWRKIFDYTFNGEYFWTGKGFGINLATDDGFQVYKDNSLRSPHNGHLTYLARMGVPGFFLWIALQFSFMILLIRRYYKWKKWDQTYMMNLHLWVLSYWVAFMVNGSFDVFLEGPQGGIWFWCLFGYGLVLISCTNCQFKAYINNYVPGHSTI
jgi:hypothetical protein